MIFKNKVYIYVDQNSKDIQKKSLQPPSSLEATNVISFLGILEIFLIWLFNKPRTVVF